MIISWIASSDASGRSIRSRTTRFALGPLLGLLAVAGFPDRGMAQDPNLVDQGRFDILLGDRPAGTETFAIRRQGEGYMAVGRLQIERGSDWLRSARFGLLTDGALAPVRYEIRSSGDAGNLIATRTGTRFRITTSTPEGDRMTELLANPNQVLVAPGIAQHYYFLVRRLSAGSTERLTALVPIRGTEAPIRVVGRSEESIQIGEGSVPARLWELNIGGTTHLVWTDPSDGRILRAEIPDRGWVSVRQSSD